MDKQQARDRIKETFEKPFDKLRFISFVKDLLNRIEEGSFIYRGQYVPDAYKPYIESLERIGKFTDSENKIDILVINLKRETSLERARTLQRNFIAWYLNGSRGGVLKDAALAAFVSPDESDWRFSLIKMEYKFEQTKTGRMKVKQEFTPARRWSFLVGANENSHTAQSRLVNILADDEQAPTLADLEEAFNIETVTKEFFLKYRDLFIRTIEALETLAKSDAGIRSDFKAKGVNAVDFAKKLLGQIIFLYFLQKKGWFGVARDADWGTGPKQFLRELFKKKHGGYKNFFNDILEPLFYEALRIDRSHDDDYYSRFNCKIPFLNGGLFDPIGNYDWVHTDVFLPDSLFSNKYGTKEGDIGDGILDIFDRYNFTVKEDEPLEKEVAIDPELLGKAYEKFNAIRSDNFEAYKEALKSGKKGDESKFNKQFGVYYTPREIVHYMCQQSLINYLFTELNSGQISYEKLDDPHLDMFGNKGKKGQLDITVEHTENPEILKEDIETLIRLGERVSENEAIALIKEQRINAGIQKSSKTKLQLSESIRNSALLIDRKLGDITVCDPAVGSGAFPVGMMSEIVKARTVLTTFIAAKDNRTSYDFKRRCIEHSLYGVDIDPGAVEIAKLRLWLSLVVDEDDIKNIKPLPNLDYKIVRGNSLLGVEKNLFNDQFFKELEKIKPLYFNETNPTKKQEYKKQIDILIGEVTNGHSEFDFEVYFSEVFHRSGGFDVVISNPPYVLLQDENKDLNLRKKYKDKFAVASYKIDLYHLFIEQGVCLLGKLGNLIYITPANFLSNNFAVPLRRFLLSETALKKIIIFAEDVFEASVNNVVFSTQKGKKGLTVFYRASISKDGLRMSLMREVPQAEFCRGNYLLIPAASEELSRVIDKLQLQNPTLGMIASVNFGMQLRDREKFSRDVLEGPEAKEQMSKDHRPCYTGKDIERWVVTFCERYCYFNRSAKRGGCWDESIHNAKNKLLLRQIGHYPEAALDPEGYAVLNTAFMVVVKSPDTQSKYLLAVLNSSVVRCFWTNKFKDDRQTFPKIKGEYLKQIPIPKASPSQQAPIVRLVEQILAAKRRDPEAETMVVEREVDRLIYELYDLTPEEIAVVETVTA